MFDCLETVMDPGTSQPLVRTTDGVGRERAGVRGVAGTSMDPVSRQ